MPRLIETFALVCVVAALACPALAATTPKEPPRDALGQKDAAGAYLAARAAAAQNDFAGAAQWYETALQADPTNPDLMQAALVADVALGQITQAAKLARALDQAGSVSQLARMVLVTQDVLHGDYAAILQDQARGATIGKLMDGLVTGWAQVGSGKMSQANDTFDTMIATPEMAAFGLYHKALALAQTGDFEGAARLFARPEAKAIVGLRRGVLAQVQILSQLDRGGEAIALIDRVYGPALDAGMAAIKLRLAQGDKIAFDVAQTPQDGMAEAFFTLSTLIAGQSNDTFTLMNTRLATALRPDHVESVLMSARVLDTLGQHDLAIAAFAQVPAEDPA
ncbi:MAG: tetratricopeptide repeat protein, partial [Pseudomonadota bacterium]